MRTYFKDEYVNLTLGDGDLNCVILGVMEELECFYYEILLDTGEKMYVSTQDVLRIAVLDPPKELVYKPRPMTNVRKFIDG